MRHTIALAFVAGLLTSGCMHALRGPAQDHALQAEEIARRCKTPISTGGYADSPCSEALQSDLDAMARQAVCIEAVAHAEKCK